MINNRNPDKDCRPKLKLPYTKIEIALEAVAAIALLATLIVTLLYYQQLPQLIPTHFGVNGEVDNYGGKASIWFLLGMQVFLYALLTVSNFFPQLYNMPVKITPENAERQYRLARSMMFLLKAVISWLFFYLQFKTIMIALERSSGLGMVVWLFMLAVFGTVVYLFIKARKLA